MTRLAVLTQRGVTDGGHDVMW